MNKLALMCRYAFLLGFLMIAAGEESAAQADPAAREPRKIALLIGIGDYRHFGATASQGGLADLQGPENDVARLRVSLQRWGFGESADTRVLLGSTATKAGIEAGFRWLGDRATHPNDAVVVFYSGHGSHAPDGSDRDEPDGRDEGLVPYDAADAHDPKQLVIDDQVRVFLAALGTENVTIIIDACYSGTVTRGHGDAVGRDKGPKPVAGQGAPSGASDDFTEARGHTLITAARSDQTAQELPFDVEGAGKVWIGALTYHLTRALDGAVATRALRYDELIDRVRSDVRGTLLPQVPQLEGDVGAVVFRSNQGVAALPFVLVSAGPGARVRLHAGAIHGVRPTAVYDIHPAGELQFAARPLAKVRVDSVVEATSFARFVDAQGRDMTQGVALPPGARAVLTQVPIGARAMERLAIYVDRTATPLAAAIRFDSLRFVITDSARAFATVTRARGVPEVLVRGIPLPPQETDSTMTLNGVTGYQPAALCGPLLRALSITTMEGIANPSPPAELAVDARLVAAGSGEPRSVLDTAEVDVAYVGQPYDIYVRVDVPADLATVTTLYMTAAIAGYTSDPFVLWPRPGQPQNPVELNRWVPIARRIKVSEPTGSEILKVVVNSNQYDLRPLVQSFGSCEQQSTATRGKGDWETQIVPITGWTALSRRIDIRVR